MNNASPEKKNSILKSLAITGFVAIIIIIAWLSIQFVNVLPSAFSSLASLADGVRQYQSASEPVAVVPLVVTSNSTLVNSDGTVDISWNTAQASGSYVFSYTCTDGVSVDLITSDGNQSIDCETNYNLGDTDSLTLGLTSEKSRFSDLTYSISFLRTNDTEPAATGGASLTIVNTDISNIILAEEEEEVVEVVIIEEPTPEPEVTPVSPPEPITPPAPTPSAPVFEQEFVFTIPTSDPNGRVDLATRFLLTGEIVNNRFRAGTIDEDEAGAMQFEVKNLGTKTSQDWTYSVSLPNGSRYESDDQAPLKPNERAVLTIGFPAAGVSSHTFVVDIQTTGDRSSLNNQFAIFVPFIN